MEPEVVKAEETSKEKSSDATGLSSRETYLRSIFAPIRNQLGQECWALNVIDVIEAAHFLLSGVRLRLSLTCLTDEVNCGRELPTPFTLSPVFTYMMRYGLPSEEDYARCMSESLAQSRAARREAIMKARRENKFPFYKITSFKVLSGAGMTQEEMHNERKKVLQRQPIIVSVEAGQSFGSFVGKGIYDKEPEEDAVTHFICALDAHDDDNPPSYTVRNSYGKRWGDKGYGRIAQSLVEWMAYPELERPIPLIPRHTGEPFVAPPKGSLK